LLIFSGTCRKRCSCDFNLKISAYRFRRIRANFDKAWLAGDFQSRNSYRLKHRPVCV